MKLHRPRTYWRMVKFKVQGPAMYAEPQVMKTLKPIRGKVFVDVGANVGMYTIPLARHFSHVYSFEPDPDTCKLLQENLNRNPRIHVTIHQCAVTDRDGKTEFYLDPLFPHPNPPTGSANTVLQQWHYKPGSSPKLEIFYQGKDSTTIETRSLDSFFQSYLNRLSWIDLVKVDVEGAEFLVLKGAEKLLRAHRITRLMIELHDRDRKPELEALFRDHGYSGRWVDPDHYYAIVEKP